MTNSIGLNTEFIVDRDLDMPCTYDESIDDHDDLRREADKVYNLLLYVYKTVNFIGFRSPVHYGVKYLEENTQKLCTLLKKSSEKDLTKLFKDARIKEARELAEWWEKHQELDKERGLEGRKKDILSKLTDEEIEILGLK